MKSNQSRIAIISIVVILAVLFNGVAFLLPLVRRGHFWTAYSFSMIAFLLLGKISLSSFEESSLKSKFYGLSLFWVVRFYAIVQLCLSVVQMLVPILPVGFSIMANLALLGGCLIGLIGVDLGKSEIERIEETLLEKTWVFKMLRADMEVMVNQTTDMELKKELKDLSEAIRYSDPVSHSALSVLEEEIKLKIKAMGDINSDKETRKSLCQEIQQLVYERNQRCKLLK